MKTNRNFIKIIVFVVAALIMMAGTALAEKQDNGNRGNHLGQNLEKPDIPEPERLWPGDAERLILMGLDLTEEQKIQIKEAVTQYFTQIKEIKLQIMQLEKNLIEEFLKAELNTETLVNLQTQISELKAQLDMKKLELLMTIKGISPELADMLILKIGGAMKIMQANAWMFPPGHNKFENGLPPGQNED